MTHFAGASPVEGGHDHAASTAHDDAAPVTEAQDHGTGAAHDHAPPGERSALTRTV